MSSVVKQKWNKKRLTRGIAGTLILSLLLALNPPLPVLAVNTYDVSAGNITIVGNNSFYTVNGAPTSGPIVITGTSTQYIVTLEASAGGTLNVTFQSLDIDVRSVNPRVAAVTTTGNVTIELDGANTLQSGYEHAGLEKSDTAGLLTIKDVDGGGSLNATGGDYGAGIGGGNLGNGSNITISGGTVSATGGTCAAGIGGGAGAGNGTTGNGSNIKIEGGNVTAKGGDYGAGIGGGQNGNCTDIEINNGTVISVGGSTAAGIGGTVGCTVSGITISGQAQVSVAGGSSSGSRGAGAAIGEGGQQNSVDGTEIKYTQQLTTGSICIYPVGTTVNQIQNNTVDPTQTIQGTGGGNNNGGNNNNNNSGNNHSGGSSSGGSSHTETHVHSYTWVITSEPTAYENGEMVYQCSCGHIASRADIEASSKLVTDGIRSFSATAQGGTVKMDFGYYFSINKAFALAHDARADVTTIITYYYQGKHYEMTIPAGFNLLQTINEKGWAGFKFIGSFPGVVTKEIP